MNKIISIIVLSGVLILTSGCENWLDLRPESEIVLEDYWQNESQVRQVLSACYRSMTEYGFLDRMMVWGELRSDNVTFGNNIPLDMNKMINVDVTPDNVYCHWGTFYTAINICNNFLHYAPDVVDNDPNFTESKLHAMEAEVITIRSLAYFYLVRTFDEVPWISQPSIDDAQDYNVPKSPGDSIINLLVTDLQWALLYARDTYETTAHTKGRVTRNAVRALLADIYLWQEEYQKCVDICDLILSDAEQNLKLVDGEKVLTSVFYNGNSSESIFELQFDDDNLFNYVLRDIYGLYGNESGQWSFPSIFVTGEASPFGYQAPAGIESEEDLREKDFLRLGGDKYYVFKYSGALRQENENTGVSSYVYRNNSPNWIFYRLPEVYLMKAEALIQMETNLQEAMDMINTTYLRANPELIDGALRLEDYNSKIDLENLLLRERQRELMFEGKRWFTLMRLARRENSPTPLLNRVMRKYTGTATVQASKMSVLNALYLPIHTDELKANRALVQNPFYEVTGESTKN